MGVIVGLLWLLRQSLGDHRLSGTDEERETPPEAGEHEPGEEFRERKTRRKHNPHQPMKKEGCEPRDDADSRHCIRATEEREELGRKTIEEETQVPEMHLDYMCMGDEKEGKNVGILGGKRKREKGRSRHGGPKKSTGDWICWRLDIIVKSDNEPALASLAASWNALRAMRMIIENSPVGSSKSNGIIERAIQSV